MFEIRVNGETVYKTEAQITAVALQSARGELYKAGISNEGVVDVILTAVQPGDPIRLDQVEAAQRRFQEAIQSGQLAGNAPLQIDNSMNMRQQVQDSTLRPGGDAPQQTQQGSFPPPSLDLAQGLDPRDGDALTARINAYYSHGDAQRAIDDNGPTGSGTNQQPDLGVVGQPSPEQQAQAEQQTSQGSEQSPGMILPPDGMASPTLPPPETTPEGQPQPFSLGGPVEPSAEQRQEGQTPGEPNPNA